MEIISSGVTCILVSHSVEQVRELCNKVLWLDHGNQILFSDNVEQACDAYEEFLMNKKQLPKKPEDVERLAMNYQIRKQMEREEREKTEAEKLEAILSKGNNESAITAAINVLIQNRPQVLDQELISRDKLGDQLHEESVEVKA